MQSTWLAKDVDAVDVAARFKDRRALVTGATQGLGLAVARLLASEGARVILTGRDDRRAEAALEGLDGCQYWHLDVREEADWKQASELLRAERQPLDVLVNNAAIVRYESLVGCPTASFREVMETNLMGVFFGMRELIPLMASGGSIVNISSCSGLEGINGASSYVASKWAVTGLTKAAALELGRRGIRVNSVHPRSIATDMIADKMAEAGDQSLFGRQALPRVGLASEVAAMVAFLASPESSYCTGGTYLVDGGHMAGQIVPTLPMS
jgi:3alpha(or 20beta)-hydroxysteroid dehydrogenase